MKYEKFIEKVEDDDDISDVMKRQIVNSKSDIWKILEGKGSS